MALHHATAKKYARNLITAIMAVVDYNIEQSIENSAELGEDESSHGSKLMSDILGKYRTSYVKAVSYTKGPTLDNGDELAVALRGLSPADVCAIADMVHGELPGTHFERYSHLNIGQRRMNAGNRIRGAVRKNEELLASVLQMAKPLADLNEEAGE